MNESRRIYPDLYGDRGPTTLAWETDGKVSRGREEPREPGRATFLTRRVTVLRINRSQTQTRVQNYPSCIHPSSDMRF